MAATVIRRRPTDEVEAAVIAGLRALPGNDAALVDPLADHVFDAEASAAARWLHAALAPNSVLARLGG